MAICRKKKKKGKKEKKIMMLLFQPENWYRFESLQEHGVTGRFSSYISDFLEFAKSIVNRKNKRRMDQRLHGFGA